MRIPVRFSPETALCGNAHLVVAPGRERQETEREGEEGGEGRRGCYVTGLCFSSQSTVLMFLQY